MTRICVVVPCHNEAEGLVEFHRRLSNAMASLVAGWDADWHVLYVDDGSRDGTRAVMEALQHGSSRVGVRIGFPSCEVLYDRAPRHAGSSKWGYWRLWNFAIEGITGFTVVPLKVATYIGVLVALLSLAYGSVIVVRTLAFGSDVPGYPSLAVIILFLGGVQLITLGVIGEYLGRVFNETKQRPIYVVETFRPAPPPG